MGVCIGKAFVASLRDKRRIHIDGERVTDVTRNPRFVGAAQSLAALYDMQHDPTLAPRMTFASPVGGAPVGLSFIEPRSAADLVRRREMVKLWMDSTCGMLGRSPDFMNVFLTGLASAADSFGDKDPRFAGAAQSLAALYNMQHDPALAPLVWAEPGQGDRIGPQICGHTIYLWKPGHN